MNRIHFDHFHLHPISPPSSYWIHPHPQFHVNWFNLCFPILGGLEAICWCVADLSGAMPLKKSTLMLGSGGTCF